MKFVTLVLFICLSLGVPGAVGQERPTSANLVELLANPDRFDGHSITVKGFLLVMGGHHDIAAYFLYLHREDAENELGNSVSVIPNEQMMKAAEKIDRVYVTLTGTVCRVRTADGDYTTVIKDIRECALWSNPSHPILLKTEGKKSH